MLSERHQKGIEARGLSAETAVAMGLYSGRLSRDGSVEADPKGDVLCFPFFEGDDEVNTKYRWSKDGQRRFMQRKDATKTVFNANVLIDDDSLLELETEVASLIWTEGEFDCMASVECGFPHSISVPDGALPGRDGKGRLIKVPEDDRDIDPDDDDKFAFMGRLMDRIMRVKHHVMAMDDDDSGRRMAKEMVRRIGAARCRWVEYPKDEVVPDKKRKGEFRACKDLNEVKQYLGDDMVREIIDNAKPWPVKGLFKLSDYPDLEIPVMHETGISEEFDKMFRLYPAAFVVVTGIPNIGKSTFINQIITNMAKIHKWPVAVFSGEKAVKPFLAIELQTAFLGKARSEWTMEERLRSAAFVERYFSFIDHDPRLDDEDIDLDYLLDRAATSVFRYGTKILMIDPWNELEHKVGGNNSMTQYVGDAIRKLKRFARSFDCTVIVVAHPTKMAGGDMPGLYNVSDSAHWANKADLGLVVHTEDPTGTGREIYIPKVRLKGLAGMVGKVALDFDPKSGLFKPPAF